MTISAAQIAGVMVKKGLTNCLNYSWAFLFSDEESGLNLPPNRANNAHSIQAPPILAPSPAGISRRERGLFPSEQASHLSLIIVVF
jgi:hypothetical protein